MTKTTWSFDGIGLPEKRSAASQRGRNIAEKPSAASSTNSKAHCTVCVFPRSFMTIALETTSRKSTLQYGFKPTSCKYRSVFVRICPAVPPRHSRQLECPNSFHHQCRLSLRLSFFCFPLPRTVECWCPSWKSPRSSLESRKGCVSSKSRRV